MTEQQQNELELAAAAEKIKTAANTAFSEQRFTDAIALYSEAITVCPSAALYSNRALANIKLESLGAAIADANLAIELDRNFAKAYYRKGTALAGLSKHKHAKKQFVKVCKLQPKNKVAAAKVKELDKIIAAEAFALAISSDEPSAYQTVEISDILVPHDYKGPHLNFPLSREDVLNLAESFKNGKMLHKKYMIQLLVEAKKILDALPTLVDVIIPTGGHFTVCGDTHGQFFDLMNIFEINGYPSISNPYLFNGDFVDRGSWSVEVLLILLAFKVHAPSSVHLNRGNHETLNMNRVYGFQGGKVLCLHGGLFSQDGVTLDDIRNIDRFREPPDEGLMSEILWSDPQKSKGRAPSKRGVGVAFGPDVAKSFLDSNDLDLLIRSHEVKDAGYEIEPGGHVVTVFSAPNYCDQFGNKGAFAIFSDEYKPRYQCFVHVPHPSVPPMAYASPMLFG